MDDQDLTTQAQDTHPAPASPTDAPEQHPPHERGHNWMMWSMCVPMLVIIGALIATGALGVGGLLYALGCLAMMGVMMMWMNHNASGPRP
jgi:predicted lipid-binding transport protein (Tim44 family)